VSFESLLGYQNPSLFKINIVKKIRAGQIGDVSDEDITPVYPLVYFEFSDFYSVFSTISVIADNRTFVKLINRPHTSLISR